MEKIYILNHTVCILLMTTFHSFFPLFSISVVLHLYLLHINHLSWLFIDLIDLIKITYYNKNIYIMIMIYVIDNLSFYINLYYCLPYKKFQNVIK